MARVSEKAQSVVRQLLPFGIAVMSSEWIKMFLRKNGHSDEVVVLNRLDYPVYSLVLIPVAISIITVAARAMLHSFHREGIAANAVVLFRFFLNVRKADALVGDLEERFASMKRTSVAKAHLWYWSQVFASLAPIICAAILRRFNLFSRRT
jgi:hypothetical protein